MSKIVKQDFGITFQGINSNITIDKYKDSFRVLHFYYKDNNIPLCFKQELSNITIRTFFEFKDRNINKYGDYRGLTNGEQKWNLSVRIAKDMIKYLDKLFGSICIGKIYQYAKHYTERHELLNKLECKFDYSDFIIQETCKCILRCEYFIREDDNFSLVKFE